MIEFVNLSATFSFVFFFNPSDILPNRPFRIYPTVFFLAAPPWKNLTVFHEYESGFLAESG